jgi:hypothetical protein
VFKADEYYGKKVKTDAFGAPGTYWLKPIALTIDNKSSKVASNYGFS